jgi:ankyrin repeat protein
MPLRNLKMTAPIVKNSLLQHKKWAIVRDVLYGKTAAVENSLDTGLSPNTLVFLGNPYSANVSLLDLAIMTGQRGIIKVLLNHDASVNPPYIAELSGRTVRYIAPLPEAAQYGEDDVIRMLLKRGANIEQKSNNYMNHVTALAAAVDAANVSTAYLLLTHGADVNSALDTNGAVPTFLIEDPVPSDIALRKLLVQYGAKIPSGQ